MLSILKNELIKIVKSKRFLIFTLIMILLCVFFGFVVLQIEKSGMATGEMLEQMIGGYFPIQILGLVSDMVLPIFATLLACFLFIDEYNSGTLKLPILCGHSRNAILTAKMITILLIMGYLMIITWFSASLVSIVFWGVKGVQQLFWVNLGIYAQTFIAMAGWSMIMILISLFLQNSGIVIGIITVILVISSIVGGMFPAVAQYIITYYLKAFSSQSGMVNYLLGNFVCISGLIISGFLSYIKFNCMEIQK